MGGYPLIVLVLVNILPSIVSVLGYMSSPEFSFSSLFLFVFPFVYCLLQLKCELHGPVKTSHLAFYLERKMDIYHFRVEFLPF